MYLLQFDFCLYYLYVYIAFPYKQVELPEDFVMSLRAETKAGYHRARHAGNLPIILVQTRWLSSGKITSLCLAYRHQSNDMENVHIASAHGTRQSRPIGVNNNPCRCRLQTTASTTSPHGLSRRNFQPPLDLSLRHLENSYPFIVELY